MIDLDREEEYESYLATLSPCFGGCGVRTYYGSDQKYHNEDGSLHTCHPKRFSEEQIQDHHRRADENFARGAPPVALITYRCPVQGRQLTVGPADYEVMDLCYPPEVEVQCLCGTLHRLNLFNSET